MGKTNKDGNYFNGYDVYFSNGNGEEEVEKSDDNNYSTTVFGLVLGAVAFFCLYKSMTCKKRR